MIEALGNLGDFIGGLGVVVTLLYLAIQIRRNTEQARLTTAGDAWAGILEAFEPIYYGDKTDVFQRGLADSPDLSAADSLTFSLLMTRTFGQFELSLYQTRHGALDKALFDMHSRLMESLIRTPGGRGWWGRIGRSYFGKEFVEHVDRILQKPDWQSPELEARARA